MFVHFTEQELEALKSWLAALTFRGTPEELRQLLAVYDRIMEKLEEPAAGKPVARDQ